VERTANLTVRICRAVVGEDRVHHARTERVPAERGGACSEPRARMLRARVRRG
jgi:hypothetical protein